MQSFFSDFQAGLRSSSSTGCILTATTTRIARTLNIALYILFFKRFDITFTNISLEEFLVSFSALFTL